MAIREALGGSLTGRSAPARHFTGTRRGAPADLPAAPLSTTLPEHTVAAEEPPMKKPPGQPTVSPRAMVADAGVCFLRHGLGAAEDGHTVAPDLRPNLVDGPHDD